MPLEDFVKEFLSNDRFWFQKNDETDKYLVQKYEHLLDEVRENDDPVHVVILYDQLPRHIFRNTKSVHIIEYFLRLSLETFQKVDTSSLDDVTWCFVHMPLRHTCDSKNILEVARKTWERATPGCHEFVYRFLRATYDRCPTEDQSAFIKTTYEDVIFDALKHAHTTFFTPEDYALPLDRTHPVVKEVESALRTVRPLEITMSISGGVDSMSLFYILSGLVDVYDFEIRVVMINYTNRPSADDEEAFVTDWVNWLGYPLSVRRIEEIRRKPSIDAGIRRTYETYTRNVRYGTYKTMSPTAYVAMGHNKDDRLENIFQNIATQTKYDNLSGMDLVVEQDGIRFFRPFLNVTKDDIIRYARSHNIPYLPNSTPPYFMRGQIRNTIVPTMNKWNAEFIPGLFRLQNVLSEMSSIVDSTVTTFVEKFDDQKRAVVDESYTRMGTYFWKSVFEKMFPDRTFKTRMMGEFSNALDRFEEFTTFQLNKNTRITMTRRNENIAIRFYNT